MTFEELKAKIAELDQQDPTALRRALMEVLSQPGKLDEYAQGVLRNCGEEDLSRAMEILAKLLDYFGRDGIGPGAKQPS